MMTGVTRASEMGFSAWAHIAYLQAPLEQSRLAGSYACMICELRSAFDRFGGTAGFVKFLCPSLFQFPRKEVGM